VNKKRSMIGKSFETRPWDATGQFNAGWGTCCRIRMRVLQILLNSRPWTFSRCSCICGFILAFVPVYPRTFIWGGLCSLKYLWGSWGILVNRRVVIIETDTSRETMGTRWRPDWSVLRLPGWT
jgi:hypothetical protein